jgi:glycine cleavage system regulatory protein
MCYVQVMRTSLVLTLIGDDKPGIVEQLADQVLATGANWEESRMARLAGKFAGVLRVSVDADRADTLAERLRKLDAGRLTVIVEHSPGPTAAAARLVHLDLIGNDHPGIVRDIARALARSQVNIEEFESDVTSAAMSGETLFRARATLLVPPGVTIEQLRTELEALAGELMVDLSLDVGAT